MHPTLKSTLEALQTCLGPNRTKGGHPVIQSNRGPMLCPPIRLKPHALVVYMTELYDAAGFRGCSSHTGRRTMITTLAQTANRFGCSLIDVQHVARHANIADTEAYVEASPFVGQMVRSL